MDEEQINELLECSVCLEQFDQSCKVLPCQHTYCRRCLDEIVLTKIELRCPECRQLIKTPVAELPTNILVMRILERLGNQKHKPSSASSIATGASFPNDGHGRSLGLSPLRHLSQDGQHITQVASHLFRQNQPFAKAMYTYESTEREDLPFKKGDIIVLKRQIDENWFLGEHGSKSGFFPANFVQVIVPLPQAPQSKALYDFDLKDENEKDCLSFKKDEVITVIRRVDENWLEGRQGDRIGIFPISFVELNDAARILVTAKSNNVTSSSTTISTSLSSSSSPPPLLAMPSSLSTSATSLSSTTVTTATNRTVPSASATVAASSFSSSLPIPASSMTPSSSSSLSPAASSQNPSPQNKRHSYSSSSPSSLSVMDSSQQRHSLEVVLGPDSFTPSVSMAVAATIASSSLPSLEQPSYSSSSITSADSERSSTASPSISPTPLAQENSTGTAANSGGASSHSGSLAPPIYLALYNYHPQKDDELVLHKGDHYCVVEKCQDGWFKGSCVKSGQSGVFPGNYVTVYRHSSAFKPMNPNILNIRAKGPGGTHHSQASSSSTSTIPPQPHAASSSGSGSNSSIGQHTNEAVLDSSITSGPPPLMPRVTKTAGVSKPRQTSSHLMAVPLRSISHPGTSPMPSSSSSSMSSSVPLSSSLMPESSKNKSPAHFGPAVFTSTHRNKTWVSSHHHLQQQQALSMTSVNIPPNVVVASSHDASSLLQSLSKDKDKKKKKDEKKKGGLLNLLKEKTHKLTSSSSDNEQQTLPVVSLDAVSHTRSGSFPAESNPSSSGYLMGRPSIEHRKALSLDSTAAVLLPPPPVPDKPQLRLSKNKYCCVVSYPPQMNYELDLEVGDIVYVLRKRDDGWYKGTQERTGKTGMFPASFVEKCD